MSTFNPDSIQTGDGNLSEPVHVGRPGQQVIFSNVNPAESYAAKYPTIESVPDDFNGTVDIVTSTYRATVKGDGATKTITGYSDSIADRPSAAALGKGSWQVGNDSYLSNGVFYVHASGVGQGAISNTVYTNFDLVSWTEDGIDYTATYANNKIATVTGGGVTKTFTWSGENLTSVVVS